MLRNPMDRFATTPDNEQSFHEAGLLASRTEPRVHNYLKGKGGGDSVFLPDKGGLTAKIYGFGIGLKVGDYLLVKNSAAANGQTRYRITELKYCTDPHDQWFASAQFDRRTPEQMDADDEHLKKCDRSWNLI